MLSITLRALLIELSHLRLYPSCAIAAPKCVRDCLGFGRRTIASLRRLRPSVWVARVIVVDPVPCVPDIAKRLGADDNRRTLRPASRLRLWQELPMAGTDLVIEAPPVRCACERSFDDARPRVDLDGGNQQSAQVRPTRQDPDKKATFGAASVRLASAVCVRFLEADGSDLSPSQPTASRSRCGERARAKERS